MQKLVPFFVMICLLTLGGCGWGGPSYWLGQYQARIEHGTRTIETAQDDTGRAAGHTERARGYAERARYSRVFKLIDIREYDRWITKPRWVSIPEPQKAFSRGGLLTTIEHGPFAKTASALRLTNDIGL